MRTVYIADDGKEFDSEWECSEYEDSLKISNINVDDIEIWNEDGDKLHPTAKDFLDLRYLDHVYYIRFSNESAIKAIVNCLEGNYGTFSIENIKDTNVIYYWNENSASYQEYEERIMLSINFWKNMGIWKDIQLKCGEE